MNAIQLTLACIFCFQYAMSAPQQSYTNIQLSRSIPQQYAKLSNEQIRRLQEQRAAAAAAAAHRPTTSAYEEYEDDDDVSGEPSQSSIARTAAYDEEENYPYRNSVIQQVKSYTSTNQIPQQFKQKPIKYPSIKGTSKDKLLEEEEKEEPDRLGLLLPNSKFSCNGRNTGYYADEGLGCEVFHYCQDNAKHSWICPEGFTFHQVHLICMPPGNDNICEKSSQYHFINEYLYKPVNLEEHQTKPNVSLKYSERFYPDNFHYTDYEDEEEPISRKQPIRLALPQGPAIQSQVTLQTRRPIPPQYSQPTFRADTTIGQVFRSPEEVNISLQQRRPPYITQRYVNQEVQQY